MTKEEKQLLLKDLCARLPYNPYILIEGERRTVLSSVTTYQDEYAEIWYEGIYYDIEDCKPYLRPMSSMTEEEKAFVYNGHIEFWVREDYCNKHHLDYCGLIEKGLALEAKEGMYSM